jgi:hypothetical protein
MGRDRRDKADRSRGHAQQGKDRGRDRRQYRGRKIEGKKLR